MGKALRPPAGGTNGGPMPRGPPVTMCTGGGQGIAGIFERVWRAWGRGVRLEGSPAGRGRAGRNSPLTRHA